MLAFPVRWRRQADHPRGIELQVRPASTALSLSLSSLFIIDGFFYQTVKV